MMVLLFGKNYSHNIEHWTAQTTEIKAAFMAPTHAILGSMWLSFLSAYPPIRPTLRGNK